MKRLIGFIIFGLGLSVHAQTVPSDNFAEHQGIRALSMGSAFRAVATDNDAFFYNPAGMTTIQRFSLEGHYLYGFRSKQNVWGVSVVDSATSKLAAGISYNMAITPDGEQNRVSHLGLLSLAYPIWEKYLSIGVSGKYLYIPQLTGETLVSRLTADAALMAHFPFGFSFGAMAYNIVPTGSDKAPLNVGLGAAVDLGALLQGKVFGDENNGTSQGLGSGILLSGDFVFRDVLNKKDTLQYDIAAGAEYAIMDIVPLRLGYTWFQATKTHQISGGVGLVIDILGINVMAEQNLSELDRRSIGVSLSLFL